MKAIIRYDAPGSVLGLDAGSLDYLGVEEEEVAVLFCFALSFYNLDYLDKVDYIDYLGCL